MELGERRRGILAAVVNDYVKTAEPVGSEALAQRYDFGVKPATIRNEMAAMSEMGYLRQPHTSAGRVPSDLGYRYYVDRLMPDPTLGPAETYHARRSYDPLESEVESIIQHTCRILSELTSYTSLATTPQMDVTSVKHVALSAVAPGKVLVVTMLNTGHIDHRVLDYPETLPSTNLAALGNLINARFQGVDLSSFPALADEEPPTELLRLKGLYKRIATILKQALLSTADDEIYMDGTSHILKQPEFARTERAAWILEVLEHRRALFQILSSALLGKDVTVIIGSENQFEEMRECSFITSQYSVGLRVCGSIGVVGPTRMDYRSAVAAVRFMVSNLSQLLTSLSIG
ncbi:MAG TPA: heat-inducible transcriptional repressor HrcA [Armatimonadota bacterium]|nr:heat-inducible transcriptional repressor HrcA [Armatimonadota bacterium]